MKINKAIMQHILNIFICVVNLFLFVFLGITEYQGEEGILGSGFRENKNGMRWRRSAIRENR
jgi:hypothetical protein